MCCEHISLYKLRILHKRDHLSTCIFSTNNKVQLILLRIVKYREFLFLFFLSIERINILSLKFFQTKKYDSIDRVIIYATLNSHQPRVDPGDILGTHRKYIESGIMYSVRHVDGGIRHCNDKVPVFEVSH